MSTSRLQRYVSRQLSIHFGKYTIRENIRPEWLIMEDGARLELDFFIKELSVAIEVQGAQHYIYIPHFHGNYDGYKKRLRFDRFKKEICFNRGIKLFEVSSKDEAIQVFEKIYSIINKDNNDAPQVILVDIDTKLLDEIRTIRKDIHKKKELHAIIKSYYRRKDYKGLDKFLMKKFGTYAVNVNKELKAINEDIHDKEKLIGLKLSSIPASQRMHYT